LDVLILDPMPAKPLKIGFVSLGCPKNLVDSEVMMGMLQNAGGELTTDVAGVGRYDSGDGAAQVRNRA
jgi:hypothetical protein